MKNENENIRINSPQHIDQSRREAYELASIVYEEIKKRSENGLTWYQIHFFRQALANLIDEIHAHYMVQVDNEHHDMIEKLRDLEPSNPSESENKEVKKCL